MMNALLKTHASPYWANNIVENQTTTRPNILIYAEPETDSPYESFDEHIKKQSTLREMIQEFQATDPGFEAELRRAREERSIELLADVQAGRLSRITAERLMRRWTQEELAQKAHMRQPNIARLEKPGASISVQTAKRIAKVFGMDDYRELLP